MRRKTTILIVFFLIISIVFYYGIHFNKKDLLLDKVEKESITTIVEGNYIAPKYCSSNKILFTNEHGNKLFLKNLEDGKVEVLIEKGNLHNSYEWDSNCENVIFKKKNKDYKMSFYSLNIYSKEINEIENIPDLTAINSFRVSDTIYFLDQKNLQIKAKYKEKTWSITNDNERYYNLHISPDGKKMIAHSGVNAYVISLESNEKNSLGKVIITDWDKESKFIIGFLDESENGHSISNSDLYLFNSINFKSKKLTNTKKYFESYPFFMTDKKIGYSDLKNGGIYQKQIQLN